MITFIYILIRVYKETKGFTIPYYQFNNISVRCMFLDGFCFLATLALIFN